MSCPPVPLPASALYTISSSQSFSPPRCGQRTMVVFCGNHANIPVGAHVEMLNPNGSTAVFRYRVVSVSSPANGQYTVELLNEGGAPDGGPIQTGNKEWIVVGSDWRESCESVPEREYATHLFVQTPPDPNDCCNPGCGCVGKIPITPGPVVFIPNPDLPGTYIPVSGSSNVNLNFGGNINIAQNLNVAGNLCNPYAISQPPDPNAQAVGVNASGCLRRIPLQRFIPDRRALVQFINTPSGTLTLTGVPAGATHAVIRATLYINVSTNSTATNGFALQVEPNDATPFTVHSIIGTVSIQGDGDHAQGGYGHATIRLIQTAPQFKWQANFSNIPPFWTGGGQSNIDEYSIMFYLDGFYVNL